METLANLESFVRSAETGGFSAAARRLSLTPAAVSRNVAMLERNLGIRLFQRSTRKLTLTEAGERFLHRDPRQSRRIAGVDRERRHGSRRTGRRAQGQHGHDVRGRIHPAAAAGFPETLSACPRRLAVREPAGRSDCRRVSTRRSAAASILRRVWCRECLRPRTSSRWHRRPILRDERRPPIRQGLAVVRWHRHALIENTAGPRAPDAQRRGRRDDGTAQEPPSRSTTRRRCARRRCSDLV